MHDLVSFSRRAQLKIRLDSTLTRVPPERVWAWASRFHVHLHDLSALWVAQMFRESVNHAYANHEAIPDLVSPMLQ